MSKQELTAMWTSVELNQDSGAQETMDMCTESSLKYITFRLCEQCEQASTASAHVMHWMKLFCGYFGFIKDSDHIVY